MITMQLAVSRILDVLGGTLCLYGTRVLVRNLFDYLGRGTGIDYFLESFDWISRKQILAVLLFSATKIERDVADIAHS